MFPGFQGICTKLFCLFEYLLDDVGEAKSMSFQTCDFQKLNVIQAHYFPQTYVTLK